MVLDPAGNVYGTTTLGGVLGGSCQDRFCGVVFKIDVREVETVIYSFTGGNDGSQPQGGGLLRDSSGILYGTASAGGANGVGTMFKLTPSPRTCPTTPCPWNQTLLYTFAFPTGGSNPYGGLIRDADGNFYGTALDGGIGNCNNGCGTVFKVDPQGNQTPLHSFQGAPADGATPFGTLLRDAGGNLYGTTNFGGSGNCSYGVNVGCGVVFKIAPNGQESILHTFAGTPGGDGAFPYAALVQDEQGNLYGTAAGGGEDVPGCGFGCGIVFELTPNPDGTWSENILHTFTAGADGANPSGGLLRDSQGHLYAATFTGGSVMNDVCTYQGIDACGVILELTPSPNLPWPKTILWNFTGGYDGASSSASLVMDRQGNLYGTTNYGGNYSSPCSTYGCGVVFKLTP